VFGDFYSLRAAGADSDEESMSASSFDFEVDVFFAIIFDFKLFAHFVNGGIVASDF
jgi:hypothetical protein